MQGLAVPPDAEPSSNPNGPGDTGFEDGNAAMLLTTLMGDFLVGMEQQQQQQQPTSLFSFGDLGFLQQAQQAGPRQDGAPAEAKATCPADMHCSPMSLLDFGMVPRTASSPPSIARPSTLDLQATTSSFPPPARTHNCSSTSGPATSAPLPCLPPPAPYPHGSGPDRSLWTTPSAPTSPPSSQPSPLRRTLTPSANQQPGQAVSLPLFKLDMFRNILGPPSLPEKAPGSNLGEATPRSPRTSQLVLTPELELLLLEERYAQPGGGTALPQLQPGCSQQWQQEGEQQQEPQGTQQRALPQPSLPASGSVVHSGRTVRNHLPQLGQQHTAQLQRRNLGGGGVCGRTHSPSTTRNRNKENGAFTASLSSISPSTKTSSVASTLRPSSPVLRYVRSHTSPGGDALSPLEGLLKQGEQPARPLPSVRSATPDIPCAELERGRAPPSSPHPPAKGRTNTAPLRRRSALAHTAASATRPADAAERAGGAAPRWHTNDLFEPSTVTASS
ncbi:hypothetical protein V8C86DRAFT_2476260 [Haematococcus lacustris]